MMNKSPLVLGVLALLTFSCASYSGANDRGLNFSKYAPAVVTVPTSEVTQFDEMWILSDIHGRLDKLKLLLLNNKLVSADGAKDKADPKVSELHWTGNHEKNLVILVGDYIDKGGKGNYEDHSGAVLNFLQRLKMEAAESKSRFVILLGNHDAEFLAGKGPDKDSLANMADELNLKKLDSDEAITSEFGDFERSLPAAAIIGTWLVAHSGYIDVKDATDLSLFDDYFTKLNETLSPVMGNENPNLDQIKAAYTEVTYGHKRIVSLLEEHRWAKKYFDDMEVSIKTLGLTGLVVGHEPSSLGIEGHVGVSQSGLVAKVDSGISPYAGGDTDHGGRMLKCHVKGISNPMSSPGALGCEEVDNQGNKTSKIKVSKDY